MKESNLIRAVRYSLLAGVVVGASSVSSPVFAQDRSESAAALDRAQVTSSRISRVDAGSSWPLTVITREQIDRSGDSSLADFLRNNPLNSFGSLRPQSGSSAQSFAGLSLRGLGEGRTLILIDGRRAPVAPNLGSAQDLNSIPLAAVERIEILADGASAIYGSDAIGGVVNIITRRDFNGVEITGGVGKPRRAGGETEQGSVVFGVSSNRGSLLAGASYNNRGIVFQRERPWSSGGISTFSNNLIAAFPAPGRPLGFVPGSFINNPTFGSTAPGFDCNSEGFFDNDGARCFYDFTEVSADEAEIRSQAVFARGTFQINDEWSTYLNAGVTRVKSFGRYAPVASSPWLGVQPFIPVGSPNHPALVAPGAGYDPDRPYFLRHRFAALGPRDTSTDNNVYDVMLGIEGRIGRVNLDIGVRHNESRYLELGRNEVVRAIAQGLIADGSYNIYQPFSNPPEILAAMTATRNRDSITTLREAYATGSMDLFELSGGMASMVFGTEYRSEDYADLYDSLSQSGQLVGPTRKTAAGGRDVRAVFVEALFPVISSVELGLALRHDDYSDVDSSTSPRLSLRYQPIDPLIVRASYGEGFHAPTLDVIAQAPLFTPFATLDPVTCPDSTLDPGFCASVGSFSVANPNLQAEESRHVSLGVLIEPTDWLDISLDAYSIEIDERIAVISPRQVIECVAGLSENCPRGLSSLPANVSAPQPSLGLGVARDPNSGEIVYMQHGLVNFGTLKTRGMDLNLRTAFELADWGSLTQQLQLAYVDSYKIDDGPSIVGEPGAPRYRAQLGTVWSYGDYTLAWTINHIHSTDNDTFDRTPSWVTHDLQANWETPWNGRVSLGVQNLADKDPPLDPALGTGFNFNLYDGYGRVPYLRYTQTF